MKRFVITGFSGFVGHHFLQYLYEREETYLVYGLDLKEPAFDTSVYADRISVVFRSVNLLDEEALTEVLAEANPDYILHLASFSSVAYSWQHPRESFVNNTNIFMNLTGAAKGACPGARILSIGSSEEYGDVPANRMPLREDMHLDPVSPYAVARVSQELLSKVFVQGYDQQIILTRSFNHIGPWQDDRFVVPSFAKRIKAIKDAGQKAGEIETGDTTIIRDFVDVRDVVRAYYMLLMDGTPGEIYNICSGNQVALSEIVDQFAQIMGVTVTTRVNPAFVRPNDNRVILGSYAKIYEQLGWEPEIALEQTLADIVAEMA